MVSRWRPTNAEDRNTRVVEGHSRNMGESWVLKPSLGCSEWKQMERFHLLISNTRPPHPSPQNLQCLTPPAVAGSLRLRVQPDISDKRRFELTLACSHYTLLCDWRELLSALGISVPLLAWYKRHSLWWEGLYCMWRSTVSNAYHTNYWLTGAHYNPV